MKREKAKQKAVAAIRDIVRAAKELAAAEAAYYKHKAKRKHGGSKSN
ncbi:MAG: hypothetical protein ACYS6W_02275 [Planctomycetota bacterium]|jgi:hypothetical protein